MHVKCSRSPKHSTTRLSHAPLSLAFSASPSPVPSPLPSAHPPFHREAWELSQALQIELESHIRMVNKHHQDGGSEIEALLSAQLEDATERPLLDGAEPLPAGQSIGVRVREAFANLSHHASLDSFVSQVSSFAKEHDKVSNELAEVQEKYDAAMIQVTASLIASLQASASPPPLLGR